MADAEVKALFANVLGEVLIDPWLSSIDITTIFQDPLNVFYQIFIDAEKSKI